MDCLKFDLWWNTIGQCDGRRTHESRLLWSSSKLQESRTKQDKTQSHSGGHLGFVDRWLLKFSARTNILPCACNILICAQQKRALKLTFKGWLRRCFHSHEHLSMFASPGTVITLHATLLTDFSDCYGWRRQESAYHRSEGARFVILCGWCLTVSLPMCILTFWHTEQSLFCCIYLFIANCYFNPFSRSWTRPVRASSSHGICWTWS